MRCNRFKLLAVLIFGSSLFIGSASAASLTWSGAAGNNEFFDADNWVQEAVPQNGDTLTFNQNESIIADFPATETTLNINQLIYTPTSNAANFRSLSIDLNGGTLNSTLALPALQVNVTDGESPSQILVFRNGSLSASEWITSNTFSLSQGWSEVRLDSVALDLGTGTLRLAAYNRTDFYIESGSVVTAGAASRFGASPNNSSQALANVYIDGAGSRLEISDRLLLGGSTGTGQGNVFVQNGGYLYVDDNIQLARTFGAATDSRGTGRLTVDGADSQVEIGNALFVGGGAGGASSTAVFNVRGDGNGHATFTNGGSGSADLLRVFYTTKGTEEEFDVFYGRLTMDGGSLSIAGTAGFEKGAVFEATLAAVPGSAPLVADGNLELARNNSTEVANTIDYAGARLELNLSPAFNPAVDDFFPLISYEGSLSGNFIWWDASLAEYVTLLDEATFSIDNYEFMILYGVASGDQDLVGLSVVAIPEPAAATLIALLATMAVIAVRRRRCR